MRLLFVQPELLRRKTYVFFKAADKVAVVGKACLQADNQCKKEIGYE